MSVTIIDEKPDSSVIKQVICKQCGVKLEYTPFDLKRESRTDYTGGSSIYEWIDCPKCGNNLTINVH